MYYIYFTPLYNETLPSTEIEKSVPQNDQSRKPKRVSLVSLQSAYQYDQQSSLKELLLSVGSLLMTVLSSKIPFIIFGKQKNRLEKRVS